MKKYSINILSVLAGLLLMVSCANEEIIEKDRGGETATVSLSLEVPDVEKIETKALNDYTLVNNLYLFIFDTDGNLEHSQEYFPGTSTTISGIEITSGDHYIYAVANTNNSYAPVPGLNNVRSKKELLDVRAQLNEKYILALSGNDVPMFGVIADESGLVNIQKGASSHKIKLKRLLSSVAFNVQCTGKNATFDLKSFEVVNIPITSTLLEKNVLESNNKIKWSGSITNSTDKQSFNFALLENAPSVSPDKPITSYEDREKKVVSTAVGDAVEFKLAPTGATYVVLKGIYKGPSETMGDVSADVTYYVHLGNTNQAQGGSNENFENRRNIDYTYNVFVKGVNELITEVSAADPYDRGDGTVSTVDQIFDVDVHYETFNIRIPAPGENEEFNYQLDEGQSFPDWVSFRIFDEVDDNHTWSLAPGKVAQWERVMKYKYNNSTTEGYNGQLITSIEGLNTKLRAYFKDHPNKTEAVITCFVEENSDNDYRESSIFRTKISGNGSNVLTNGFRIRQNYGRKFFDNGGGYMLEVLNETGKLNNYGSHTIGVGSLDDGLETMKKELGNVSAGTSEVRWPSKDEMMKIYAACMARNRDEDGDGNISDEEVKWYLPAINQYIGMWMGAGALKEASLYMLDYSSSEFHYMSNSYKDATDQLKSKDAKYILWSEEGSSTGPRVVTNTIDNHEFRCIRNFGNETNPKYYEHDMNAKTITTYLNEGAYRAKQTSGEVGKEGGHMGESNKLYPTFKYSDVEGNGALKPGNVIENADRDNSLCSNYHEGQMKKGVVYKPTTCEYDYQQVKFVPGGYKYFLYVGNKKGNYALGDCEHKFHNNEIMKENRNGDYVLISEKEAFEDGGKWRLPNQRELVMMNVVGLFPDEKKYFMSRTVSKFESNRTFIYHGSLTNLSLMDVNAANIFSKFYVRCVRDY